MFSNILVLIIAAAYIVAFTYIAYIKIVPLLADADRGYDRHVRVSVAFLLGACVYSAAWGYVLSVISQLVCGGAYGF